ncbi:hypothetical protein LAZ67_8004005 [Cordylochernes scorpioides]|uniref:C2H2-type domain-containing protein n=1 Tax=Cordylochernes scorpioides TaxID=51811 RepID=A0ABY6KS15_9ARAC|nr:hypothetical protein LAZ67_8004005 [Cordylochernes scorpioides]
MRGWFRLTVELLWSHCRILSNCVVGLKHGLNLLKENNLDIAVVSIRVSLASVHPRIAEGEEAVKKEEAHQVKLVRSSSLKIHIRNHTGEKPHLCPHCDYRTNQSSTLKTNIRTHTGEKPQLCPLCDYRTNQSSNLKIHIRTHTGETNYSYVLKIHIRTHTVCVCGEKPHLCPHCEYRTINSSNLRKHIRTRTN